jgi:glycerol-3-phosphate dehydrogenase (NAD(P)+)
VSAAFKVSVVGGGPWGRALAAAAARTGTDVTLITRRPEAPPEGVRASHHLADAARGRLVMLAVPSAHAAKALHELGAHLDGGHFLVHGIRGLVGDELTTISEVARREAPVRRVGALGGPVQAEELLAGSPSVMVVGSRFKEVLDAVREAYVSPNLRLYATRDLAGLEWASALTGCLVIAIGYALGSGVGPGLVAAFTTRAVHEAARVAVAAGGESSTLLGLAGLGDLLAAVGQDHRPEVVLGRALAQGRTMDDAKRLAGMRIEALDMLPVLHRWITRHDVRAPILGALVDGIIAGRPRDEMIAALMTSQVVDE